MRKYSLIQPNGGCHYTGRLPQTSFIGKHHKGQEYVLLDLKKVNASFCTGKPINASLQGLHYPFNGGILRCNTSFSGALCNYLTELASPRHIMFYAVSMDQNLPFYFISLSFITNSGDNIIV